MGNQLFSTPTVGPFTPDLHQANPLPPVIGELALVRFARVPNLPAANRMHAMAWNIAGDEMLTQTALDRLFTNGDIPEPTPVIS
jgi:hypothetical protein